MYRSYIESQVREMMDPEKKTAVSQDNWALLSPRTNMEIIWQYLSGSFSFLSTFWVPRIQLTDMLGYGYMGWFSTRKEEKQEMIKQLQNLDTGSDEENIKLEIVDLENIHEMNKIFQNIIKNEEERKQETGVTIRIEDFEEKKLLENDINENVMDDGEEQLMPENTGMDVGIKNIEEVFDDGQDKDENGPTEQDEDSSPDSSHQEVLIKIDAALELSDDDTKESSEGQRKGSFESLTPIGKLSRSNSLLALNEALTEAGEAIKNMDESEKKALDDFNFNDMQVEAIKFLAELPKKSLKEGRK